LRQQNPKLLFCCETLLQRAFRSKKEEISPNSSEKDSALLS
jgi:hypothetical protein